MQLKITTTTLLAFVVGSVLTFLPTVAFHPLFAAPLVLLLNCAATYARFYPSRVTGWLVTVLGGKPENTP